ncbi:MAG TPA: DinB family protein [Blastocatellia bacterium]|nr:DinB family protein [Blastocatellia bacterium]
MDDTVLREELVKLLRGGQAHVTPENALAGVNSKTRSVRPAVNIHSVWEELEHLRLAQEDILRYAIDPSWQSPEFPDGYWPPENQTVTDEMWQASVDTFMADLKEVVTLVQDPKVELTAKFPHGEWRTYLRQVMVVAAHNAYHLGQLVQARKMLGDWPE